MSQAGPLAFSSNVTIRPDGGFTMTNIPVTTLIARAHDGIRPADMVGLPDWARSERYDVSATSMLTKATADDRVAMMRAMLADRFKLVMHFEKREQPAVPPGRDRFQISTRHRRRARCAVPGAATIPATGWRGKPRWPRSRNSSGHPAGRFVVDKTGLSGSYRVKMNFELFGSRRPPEVTPPPDAAPTVFHRDS